MADPFAQYAVADDPFAAYAARRDAPQDAGFLQGVLNKLPTPSNVVESIKAIPGNIKASFAPDALEQWQARDRTQSPTGKMLHGQPMEGAGELLSTLGQLALGEAGTGYLRTRLGAANETINGIPVKDLEAAGVGKPSLDLMRNGRQQPAATGPRLVTKTPTPPQAAPPTTQGNLALKPEFQPVDAPVAQPTPTPMAGGVSPLRQQELLQKFGGMMAAKGATVDPNTSVTINPKTAGDLGRLTPEQAAQLPSASEQARNIGTDWRSFAEPGTSDAQSASALHKYDAEMASRLKYLMDSDKGAISPSMLREAPGRMIPAAAAEWAARHFLGAPPFVGSMVGMATPEIMGAAGRAAATPVGNAALRAALLARLAAGERTTADTASQR